MGKLQLIFETNLDWHLTLDKAAELFPGTEPTEKESIQVYINQKITEGKKELFIYNVQITNKGTVMAFIEYEGIFVYDMPGYGSPEVDLLWKKLHTFCLTATGEPCKWEFLKANPLYAHQIYHTLAEEMFHEEAMQAVADSYEDFLKS